MKLNMVGAAVLAVAMGVGASAQQGDQRQGDQKDKQNKGEMVTVEGCLSSGEQNGIILTADPGDMTSGMATATGRTTPTVTYQLVVRDAQEFAGLIGKRVQVRGRADEDPRAKAETERKTETSTTGTAGAGSEAKVETTEKVKVEVRKLTVTSFKPVAGSCPAAKR